MIEIVFITSNNEKLAHARHLCKEYDVFISKQKHYGKTYDEPRLQNKAILLEQSFEDAYKRWKKNVVNADDKFFFIEDTSVIIKSLSSNGIEIPGTEVKYWMQENDFEKVDKILKQKGNNRTAIVKSDLLLFFPTFLQRKYNLKYKIFTSQIIGRICDKEYPINPQPFYSWLSDKTFNKWFIPEGCDFPASLLPIDIIDKHDFRAGAFKKMLSFLENEYIIKKKHNIGLVGNLNIFEIPLIVLCGPTCAGKTTLAEYLRDNYDFYHFEASDFMYQSYYEHHGVGSKVNIADFAETALKENPCIVSDKIRNNLSSLKDIPIVITGFRDFQEIECLKNKITGNYDVDEFYIDAKVEIRYQRNTIRQRIDGEPNFERFKSIDQQQFRMGLDKINSLFIDNKILNESTKENYYNKFEEIYNISNIKRKIISSSNEANRLEELIILTLAEHFYTNRYFTTAEIAKLITNNFIKYPKNKNNVSRYFNQNFHPYYEIKILDNKKRYKLSQTGYSYSKYLRKIYNKLYH